MKIKNENELAGLAKLLSGELELEKQQKRIERVKKEAIKKQKYRLKNGIKSGKVELDMEELIPEEMPQKVIQKIKLYEWSAPIRLKFPFDQKTFMVMVAVALAFILYLAVMGHYGLMFVIIALLFFIYVAGSIPPISVTHSITTRGIDSIDKLYEWHMLDKFWFTIKNGQPLLIVTTKLRFPAKLIMLLEKSDMEPIFVLLQDKLLYRDLRKQGRVELATYGEYLPIEKI